MSKLLLDPIEAFTEESFNSFNQRYSGFGKDIYQIIQLELPEIFNHLKFFKRIFFQPEDSYALYCNADISFVIQLDPLCEVIVLWNVKTRTEIGSWSPNEYDEALDFIKSDLL